MNKNKCKSCGDWINCFKKNIDVSVGCRHYLPDSRLELIKLVRRLQEECEELKDIRAQLIEDMDRMKNQLNCRNYDLRRSNCMTPIMNCPCDKWELK